MNKSSDDSKLKCDTYHVEKCEEYFKVSCNEKYVNKVYNNDSAEEHEVKLELIETSNERPVSFCEVGEKF
jgi:hypothetical protein